MGYVHIMINMGFYYNLSGPRNCLNSFMFVVGSMVLIVSSFSGGGDIPSCDSRCLR